MIEAEKEIYLAQLEASIRRLVERIDAEDGTTIEYAALELLASMFDAASNGVSDEELAQAIPIASWRNNTVSVPLALLGPIVLGWLKYREGDAGRTLGECLMLEGGGQGKSPVIQKMISRSRRQRLSNSALAIIAKAKRDNLPMTQLSAFTEVAASEGVSVETVRSAFKAHSQKAKEHLRALGIEV